MRIRSESDRCVLVSAAIGAPDDDVGVVLRSTVDEDQEFRASANGGKMSVFVPVGTGTTVFEVDPDRAPSQLTETDKRLGTVYISDLSIAGAPDDQCA